MKKNIGTAPSSSGLRTKTEADKVIGFILGCTPLRKYRGVLENYIRWSLTTLRSEGKQAQDRLAAYVSFIEGCITHNRILEFRPGKYRKLQPVLKILDRILESEDYDSLRWLQTAVRVYELARPTKKMIDESLQVFLEEFGDIIAEFDSIEKLADYTRQSTQYEPAAKIVAREAQRYPDFPWEDFRNFLYVNREVIRGLVLATVPKPPLSASLLTKSSASKICVGMDKAGNRRFKSIPAIAMADLEIQANCINRDKVPEGRHLLQFHFADSLLKSLNLDQSYHYVGSPESFVKDRQELLKWFQTDYVRLHMHTVGIEASKSMKVRIVHKTAYDFQHPLELLHRSLLAASQKIPGDYSGDHDAGFNALNDYARDAEFLSDVDATSWTDYFPLAVQYEVLKTAYGQDVADDWVLMMRSPIAIHTATKDNPSPHWILYRMFIGQPMGAYGSWAKANFAHHWIYRFAAYRANSVAVRYMRRVGKVEIPEFLLPYYIIGDDECSADPLVQVEYTRLLSALGMKLNSTKAKTLSRSAGTRVAELANRQTLYGTEISRISPKLVANCLSSYARLWGFLRFARSRNARLDMEQLLSSLEKESSALSRQKYKTKYGVYPISKRKIDVGRRIPSCVGGLVPDEIEWHTYVDPRLICVAILSKISAMLSMIRPGAPILRDGRDNADQILNAMNYLPPSVDVGQSALARYERRMNSEVASSAFYREIGVALEQYLRHYERSFQILSAATSEQREYLKDLRNWYLNFVENLESIAATPHYDARERQEYQVREMIESILDMDPGHFPDHESWWMHVNVRYQDIVERTNRLSRSFLDNSKKTSQEDLASYYEDMFG